MKTLKSADDAYVYVSLAELSKMKVRYNEMHDAISMMRRYFETLLLDAEAIMHSMLAIGITQDNLKQWETATKARSAYKAVIAELALILS